MIDRFSLFAKRHSGKLAGIAVATLSSVGIYESVMLNYDRFVYRLAEDTVYGLVKQNIRDQRQHRHPRLLFVAVVYPP